MDSRRIGHRWASKWNFIKYCNKPCGNKVNYTMLLLQVLLMMECKTRPPSTFTTYTCRYKEGLYKYYIVVPVRIASLKALLYVGLYYP